ncbi:MAG: tetratricopeptide repeat protein [Promethearchaeota archaeon]
MDAAKTCLKYDPENSDAHFIMGESYRFLRNYNSAIDCYKKALKINPIHKKAAQSYIGIVKNTGTEQQKCEWSEFIYREVIKISPTKISNWEGKGIQFYSFGTVEQNIEDLQSRIDIFLDLNQFILESINFFVIEQQMIVSIEEYPYAFKEFKETYNVKLIKFGRNPIKL